jgi:3-oxoacyl-[acyl-carrier protein] reductase
MSEAIRGRVVLVTGGASGIGRGIADAFAEAGGRVALSYATSGAEAAGLAARLGALALPADLTRPEAARSLVAAVTERLGPVEILVANAGGLLKRTAVVECDLALWNQAIALNLTSVFLSCQAVLPDMLAARRGCIITVSSLAGHDGGGIGAAHYGAAKGGVITFTKALAKEVGPQGIRVNGIAPGLIATRFHDTFSTADARRATVERTPLRREGTPADVAGAALFLASDQAGFIAGETIEVNGGLGLF